MKVSIRGVLASRKEAQKLRSGSEIRLRPGLNHCVDILKEVSLSALTMPEWPPLDPVV